MLKLPIDGGGGGGEMSCMRGGQKIYAWDENVSSFFFFFFEGKVGLEVGELE